jgi:hypothetical protein
MLRQMQQMAVHFTEVDCHEVPLRRGMSLMQIHWIGHAKLGELSST